MSTIKTKWAKIPKPIRIVCYTVLGIIGTAALGFIFGIVIQSLWNWLMPELFHLKEITYWQAIGIFILAKIIFGSINSGGDTKDSKKKKQLESNADASFYDEWWEKEGKKAFEQYTETKT